tara:strand:+ start:3092 stop:3358 length:267 start_codon:yes stop_codon:yes gene_type:complete
MEKNLNSNPNEEPSSPRCIEPGKSKRDHSLNLTIYDRHRKYSIVKYKSEYQLQRSGDALFSSDSKEKIENIFKDMIRNNGGFLTVSSK